MKDDFKLEQKVEEIVNKDEVLPESVKAKTQLAYKEIKSMSIHTKKTQKKKWVVAASLIAASAISLQSPLLADIRELFFGGNYKGVESAIKNGQLQSLEGIVSESNGIKLEVIGGLVDPTIIHLRLKLTAEDPELLKNFEYNQHTIQFIDQFNVTDDQGRIIQRIEEEGVYIPPFINEQGEKIHLLSSSSEQVNTRKLDQGEIEIDMIFNSSEGNYGDIKGLTLQSNQLNKFEGDWTLEVPFTSKMIEAKGVVYEVTAPNDQIAITSAITMKTGLKIDCIVKVPVDENVINSKIVGEDGTTFTTGRAGAMENTPQGERVVLTFEVLEEELGESFTLQIPTLEGIEECITLTKVTQ